MNYCAPAGHKILVNLYPGLLPIGIGIALGWITSPLRGVLTLHVGGWRRGFAVSGGRRGRSGDWGRWWVRSSPKWAG
jgi:hypothetical protein